MELKRDPKCAIQQYLEHSNTGTIELTRVKNRISEKRERTTASIRSIDGETRVFCAHVKRPTERKWPRMRGGGGKHYIPISVTPYWLIPP